MITSDRFYVVPMSREEAHAILSGTREGRNWASGYPTDEDTIVARHL